MQNEFQPEPTEPDKTPRIAVTETDFQTAQFISARLKAINNQAISATRRNRKSRIILCCGFVISSIVMLFLHILLNQDSVLFSALFFASFVFVSVGITATWSWDSPTYNIAEVARDGGVKAIAPLFATLQTEQSALQVQAIRNALTRLLPQMEASDAPLLTPACHQTIHEWLAIRSVEISVESHHNDLRIAALKALQQVGDFRDISAVEQVATTQNRAPDTARVRQAASECLPLLRARCGKLEASRTLLRASSFEDARPETLLRPASGAGQNTSAELLRGTNPPDARE